MSLILKSLGEILHTAGIGAVTTNAIAARAGIPVSSIYQYFPNKEEILCALYEDYLADITRVLDEFVAQSGWTSLEDFFTSFIKAIYRQETRDHIESELENAARAFPEVDGTGAGPPGNNGQQPGRRTAPNWAHPCPASGCGGSECSSTKSITLCGDTGRATPRRPGDHLDRRGTAAVLGVVRQCMPD